MSSKNKGMGGRNRRKRARRNDIDLIHGKEFEKNEGQEYAKVIGVLGSGRFKDNKTRICKVRGKMQRKEYVRKDDLVLVELRDYQDDKADIVHRFGPDEVKKLVKDKQVPDFFVIGLDPTNQLNEFGFEIVESSGEEESWEESASKFLAQPNRNLDVLPDSDSEEEPAQQTTIDFDRL